MKSQSVFVLGLCFVALSLAGTWVSHSGLAGGSVYAVPTNYTGWLAANSGHLDGAFTGGFGEQSCHACHFDYDLNNPRGSLRIIGLPEKPNPDTPYELTIELESERLIVGGFQLTIRFADGNAAGDFSWDGDHLGLTPGIASDIPYLQHSEPGYYPESGRTASWSFTWNAPDLIEQPILVHIAANAGNDDDSSFGDWIYVREYVIE